jgi:hypothetical protein
MAQFKKQQKIGSPAKEWLWANHSRGGNIIRRRGHCHRVQGRSIGQSARFGISAPAPKNRVGVPGAHVPPPYILPSASRSGQSNDRFYGAVQAL